MITCSVKISSSLLPLSLAFLLPSGRGTDEVDSFVKPVREDSHYYDILKKLMLLFSSVCGIYFNLFHTHTFANLLRLLAEGVLPKVLVSWSFLKLLSSVFLSLPGHAHTRTSKDLRPSNRPLQDKSKSRFDDPWYPHWNTIHEQRNQRWTTHSWVSRLMIVRMGRRFIPPMQLLLHIKLYNTVVNSAPSCKKSTGKSDLQLATDKH